MPNENDTPAARTVLVTGATRGIGRAIAERFVAAGDRVATLSRGSDVPDGVLAVPGDVTDTAAIDAGFAAIEAELGPVEVLVANAGITRDGLLMRMKEEDWDAVLTTNLKGVFNCTKAAIKYMMKQKAGKIVSISSVVGLMGNAGQANYAAAKAGVIGFTKSVAKEVAARGINVNAVAPGFIKTDMTSVLSDKVVEGMLTSIPLHKLGETTDIAKAVVFLVSDDANYITGQTLHVDGGMVM